MRSREGPSNGPDESRHDPGQSAHPEANDLQRYADRHLDPDGDAALLQHVEACATCQAEVERIRSAAASLALSSAPPPDLFARIKARRAAGEQVELPVDELSADDVTAARDGHPALLDVHRIADGEYDADGDASLVAHVQACVACRREVEDVRRVTAILSVLSHPPNELLERIKARRASGERVILPVDMPASTHEMARRRGRRLQPWGLAIAASLLLAIGIGREAWKRNGPRGAAIDSVLVSTALRNAADSAERLWLTLSPDIRRARWREMTQSLERLHAEFGRTTAPRSDTDSAVIGILDDAFDGAVLTSAARGRTRELGVILSRRPEYRVAIVGYAAYVSGDSAANPLSARLSAVRDALQSGGVAADRVTLSTVGSPRGEGPGGARLEVVVLAPKPAPELR